MGWVGAAGGLGVLQCMGYVMGEWCGGWVGLVWQLGWSAWWRDGWEVLRGGRVRVAACVAALCD